MPPEEEVPPLLRGVVGDAIEAMANAVTHLAGEVSIIAESVSTLSAEHRKEVTARRSQVKWLRVGVGVVGLLVVLVTVGSIVFWRSQIADDRHDERATVARCIDGNKFRADVSLIVGDVRAGFVLNRDTLLGAGGVTIENLPPPGTPEADRILAFIDGQQAILDRLDARAAEIEVRDCDGDGDTDALDGV